MRKLGFAIILALGLLLPMQAHAEERTDWLLHGSDADLQAISQKVSPFTKEFKHAPLGEVQLTQQEVDEIRSHYPDVNIYPNREYGVAAAPAAPAPPSQITYPKRFTLINTTPEAIAPYTGKGVRVAVLDSGIDVTHSKLSVKGGFCALPKDQCAKGTVLYNDDLGHGTHVAGILSAAKASNGTMGVAPGVDLYAIKAINSYDSGRTIDIINGVEWAINNKIDILNMSITTNRDDPALKLMLEKAYATGMIIVAAAGNEEDGNHSDSVQYPAKYSTVIATSAVNIYKERFLEASMGPEVELAAPGVDIFSTFPRELDDDGKKDGYYELSGTSMAAPHVSGIAALLKERFPEMTNIRLRSILANSAEDLGARGRDRQFGYGLVRYPSKVEEIPMMTQYTQNGRVVFELSNADKTSTRQLKIEERTISEQSPGKWETYLLPGTYKGKYAIMTNSGKQIQEDILVKIEGKSYKDVSSSKWYAPQIAYLADKELIYGFEGNVFKPDQKITRAEAVAIMGRATGLNGERSKTKFKDVNSNSFASGYIQSAQEKGYLSGFPDNTFRPNQPVTRGEMALLLQKAFTIPFDSKKASPFSDLSPKASSYEAVLALTQSGVTKGYPDGTFKPYESMTRATYSVFLAGAENPSLFR
ncbi:alkaline serine protease [Sporosarcina sp. BI001-red]|uniref:S8 family peptidase n=1 Tax=Sporosarcina sp. BI001-red TaxID=2282866 RepID=UPI000E26DC19|nr:S8 family serine peptidase [Sporosarcina sp. BI001-red]REB08522.1 alkaline serine protease [Sporosarcina sp. BI001-red]